MHHLRSRVAAQSVSASEDGSGDIPRSLSDNISNLEKRFQAKFQPLQVLLYSLSPTGFDLREVSLFLGLLGILLAAVVLLLREDVWRTFVAKLTSLALASRTFASDSTGRERKENVACIRRNTHVQQS